MPTFNQTIQRAKVLGVDITIKDDRVIFEGRSKTWMERDNSEWKGYSDKSFYLKSSGNKNVVADWCLEICQY